MTDSSERKSEARDAAKPTVPPGETFAVTPLITAAEAYPALERAVAAARREVALSFRVFDTRTRLRTDEAREAAGGRDWAALLAAVAARGVKVRLQLSDFDPIGGAPLHRDAWASLRYLAETVRATNSASDLIEAMAARHEAELGVVMRLVFAGRARRERRRIEAEDDVDYRYPGLRSATSGHQPHLYPATHHQKMAVVDDDFALIGGLDVDERRWDTEEHDRPAEETWRDVSVTLGGGAAAAEIRAATAAIWTDCAAAWAARVDRGDGLEGLAAPRAWRPEPVDAARTAADSLSVIMTRSEPRRHAFAFSPRTVRAEIETTVLEMIGSAKRFIYLETQFLRHRPVARALAAAARRTPDLELVAILPFAPERYAFEGRRDTAMAHAEALQLEAVDMIRDAFGERVAFLSLAKDDALEEDDAFVAYGAGIVYLHSKILIVDGERALIGSANLNGRSMRWDTEAALRIDDAAAVMNLQERLADSLDVAAQDLLRVAPWAGRAQDNAATAPSKRIGILLPHDTDRARSFAKKAFWLPNNLF